VATSRGKKAPAKKSVPKKKPARQRSERESLWSRHQRDIWIVVLFVIGIFALLAQFSVLGPVGQGLSRVLADAIGISKLVVPLVLLVLGVLLVWNKIEIDGARLGWGIGLGMAGVSGLGDLSAGHPSFAAPLTAVADAGGFLGVLIGNSLVQTVGVIGGYVTLVAIMMVASMVLTGIGLRTLLFSIGRGFRFIWRSFKNTLAARAENGADEESDEEEHETEDVYEDSFLEEPEYEEEPEEEIEEDLEEELEEEPVSESFIFTDTDEVEDDSEVVNPPPAPKAKVPTRPEIWELPPLSLLTKTKDTKTDRSATDESGEALVAALNAHGVETTLVGYTVGPAVTRFELEIGPGVKVAKITSLNKDIAYAMASPDVRILAPIPGRSAIGIEVPNRNRSLVALGDVMTSPEAQAAHHPLDVPLGRDISGKTVMVNLGEMPHVLISGATGAGKSSCINSLITGLVMRATPDQLRLVLIDPKRVELGQYNDLPHLLSPVVVDPRKAANILNWAVKEMESRYDLLAEHGARDITSYHQMIERGEIAPKRTSAHEIGDIIESVTGLESEVPEPEAAQELPYIVIVVDELNDLMMVAARDVEDSVVRIAQMARAVGIHLVLATQRPSVDVITGVIKANVPSRMAFAVSSLADSRVILDQAGAERLIGKGDMLLLTASSNVARRIQSPWVSEEEVRKVVGAWKSQGGRPETIVAADLPSEKQGIAVSGAIADSDDEVMLQKARELVLSTQSGSTSMLQRKLRIGFARAGRIMDQLEEDGIVAPGDGSKARKVMMTLEQYENENS
jgi:S-DNA-T family DNA segregation ATPase FtsK/SpoIIIE